MVFAVAAVCYVVVIKWTCIIKKLNGLDSEYFLLSGQMNTSNDMLLPVSNSPSPILFPSRVSRKGLPCPEIWDTHIPIDDMDMRGFIEVRKNIRVRRSIVRGSGWCASER